LNGGETLMRAGTLDDWQSRIEKVLTLISSNLCETLPLRRLAAEASLSPFHFHRIWRATTGEPIGETIRRLRLEKSLHSLQTTSGSVTQIAFESGFGSSQAFSRAFKQATGRAPSAYRAKPQPAGIQRGKEPRHSLKTFDVEVVSLKPFRVISKRRYGAYDERRLAETFRIPWDWAMGSGYGAQLRGIYGVPHDDPKSVPASRLRYDACLDLGADIQPPPYLRRLTLGGGDFAKLTVTGSYKQLDDAYQYLLGTWLSGTDREADDRPLFNHFQSDPDVTPEPDRVTDVYLPLIVEGAGHAE
jgi:AraC family transcriptional regulator